MDVAQRFHGKTAIVTGASRGIGLGIAHQLVSEGARVVITARHGEVLEKAADELGGSSHAIAVPGRADDLEHQARAVAAAIEHFGSLDILVNNTGINPVFGPLVETDLGAARKIIEVNCVAALSWVQHAYRAWMHEHGGSVLNMGSASGVQHPPGVGFYGASKAMLTYITAQLALELGPGIRVNGIAPAIVKTSFAVPLYEGKEDEIAATYPLKRLGETQDIAQFAAFLLSDEASWLTGQTYIADGGVTLRSIV
jgi:NAD(P)-dependent dehydrogenase (short-subunit alcohol dehydrogenase family)